MPRTPLFSLRRCEQHARNVVLALGGRREQEHVFWYTKDGGLNGNYAGWNNGASAPQDLIEASKAGLAICFHHNHPERATMPAHPPSDDDWTALCGMRTEPEYAGMQPLAEIWVHGPRDVFYCLELAKPAADVWTAWQALLSQQSAISWNLFGHPVVSHWWFHHAAAMALELAGYITYRWDIPSGLTAVWDLRGPWGSRRARVVDVLDTVANQIASTLRATAPPDSNCLRSSDP